MSSTPKPNLRLDWCSHEAAKYAVAHWHYSRSMPAGKTVKVGVWESERYIGCVIFARGSNKYLGMPFGLSQLECVELIRVALDKHATPVSRIVSIACKMLKRHSVGLRLVISFADTHQGHVGTIYQAGGWVYSGVGTEDKRCRPYLAPSGDIQHWRAVNGILNKRGLPATIDAAVSLGFVPQEYKPKHRYLYPLDAAMRAQIAPLAKTYPKRGAGETDNAARPNGQTGGASPTAPLLAGQHG